MKTRHLITIVVLSLGTLVVHTAFADTVLITDGSRIVGTIEQLADGKLVIATEFAGRLEIDSSKIEAFTAEQKVNLNLASGDRLVGTVELPTDTESPIVQTAMGPIDVAVQDITAVWPEGREDPQIAAVRAEAKKAQEAMKPKWSATLEAGAVRTEGNTDTLDARGRFDLRRKTQEDLLKFYLAAEYAEKDKKRDRNEYKGGILYENLLNERWNWYTRLELEFDEFEDLDLRATAAAGAGYYWLKKPDHELQTRVGAGYRHESYDTGETNDDAVVDLGLDYRLDITPWAQFTHSTVWAPNIEELSDYRLTLDTALALPLANSDVWKLKLGMTNEYNSDPQPGFDRLDNTYYANIVLEVK